MKQLILDRKIFKKESQTFGGETLKGKRKTKRPLNLKQPLHLILHADVQKSGSMLRKIPAINQTIKGFSSQFNVKIYEQSVNSNHIHFVLKFSSREDYRRFVRAVCGVLARLLKIKWDHRPYSRIIQWGRDFKSVLEYVVKNILESEGLIPYVRGPPKRQKIGQP